MRPGSGEPTWAGQSDGGDQLSIRARRVAARLPSKPVVRARTPAENGDRRPVARARRSARTPTEPAQRRLYAVPVLNDHTGEIAILEPLPDDDPGPYELAAAALERAALEEQISRLRPAEGQVLRARFGLDGPPVPLAHLGDEHGLTVDRVREIEELALSKLRHPTLARLGTANRPMPPRRGSAGQ